MPKSVDTLIDELIAREGGYVNHAADRGGPTNFGITQEVARATGFAGDMRDFPRSAAVAIYRRRYWEQPGFAAVAALAPRLAEELFDTAVNMGPNTAAKFLQRALSVLNRNGRDYPDVIADGKIGPAVIYALRQFLAIRGKGAEAVLVKGVECLQGYRYIELAEKSPTQEAFAFGWLAHRIGNTGE